MRLISCYITAFAGILDREIRFQEGITEICEANGTGKSTLAAFLKAMLYGLDGVGKRAVSENELKLYRPFSGGRFGGSLTFSTDGREYRIERYFEEKAEEVRVIDTLTGEETEVADGVYRMEYTAVNGEIERTGYVYIELKIEPEIPETATDPEAQS